MLNGNGFGFNWKGLYVTSLIDAHSAWRQRADEFSDTLKTTILFGQYALNKYRGHYYAKRIVVLSVSENSSRSEEHTSELQSLAYLVCRLLLEKKNKTNNTVTRC